MGRWKNYPTEDGRIVKEAAIGSSEVSAAVLDRLGFNSQICMDCNARNKRQDKCRKCGSKDLRKKASDFRGKGSENN